MKNKQVLIKQTKKLLRELGKVGPFVEASLGNVDRICGNKNCSCRKDPNKKHKAYYFTWKESKKTVSLYVPVYMWDDAIQWAKNYKKVKLISKKISDAQKKILKFR